MDPVTMALLIRALSTAVPHFLTLLNQVESDAGKPLDEMTDDELVALLRTRTKTTDELLEEGRQRARD